ncbi:MAG: hypothetical protein M1830_006876 [Pleopsidium flavum]|nr:MAG: hypothetical protein M1830_006876 [Pleopsidium flavum]
MAGATTTVLPETEAYTTHLATLIRSRLRQNPQCPRNSNPRNATAPLRILDLCTGTGCIPLLLHSLLSPHTSNLILLGVDICPKAIALARQNLHWNIAQGNISASANKQVHFARGDILAHHLKQPEEGLNTLNDVFNKHGGGKWDILISNPPYISPRGFNKDTARSVRAFEPRLALVPSRITSFAKPCRPGREIQRSDDQQGDVFYHSLLAIAERVNAKIVVMEVGDLEQGRRVVALMGDGDGWEGGEIWRDWVDGRGSVKEGEVWEVGGREVRVRGEGNGRAVICFRGCAWNGVEA